MSAPTVRFDVVIETIGEHGSPLQKINNFHYIKTYGYEHEIQSLFARFLGDDILKKTM